MSDDISVDAAAVAAAASRLGPAGSLVASVLDIAGARALALDALLRLSAIEWSAEVTTAMVECTDRPRILINPVFVERHCTTRERLAALLLHELSHVSLGHTKLFPHPTVAHNIAFDAIINRELLTTALHAGAGADGMAALFVDLYQADESPCFLLRPPPGWPADPDWNASRGCPPALRAIHRRLYHVRKAGARSEAQDRRHQVMYSEIVAALHQAAGGDGIVPAFGPGAGDIDAVLHRLLGGHGTTAREQAAMSGGRDALAADALASALAPVSGMLAGAGGDLASIQIAKAARRVRLQHALAALLRRVAQQEGARRGVIVARERAARSVDPSRDRRAPARRALATAFGTPQPLLFDTTISAWKPRASESIVYLDVSGSMGGILPILHAALVPLRREHRPIIHVFSTAVMRVKDGDFDRGRLPTTGGTCITPVLEHLLDDETVSRARAAVVLTDGYFGPPPASLTRRIAKRGIQIHLGVGAGGPLHDGESWVASATRLPSL